ncbi:hypothetical protein [Neobacillus cucumis]|uniref:Uncharacterized protein n=1 Tax=Neobacillus cucumis TaxID=1740721 RepID=A0A2N5H707_9BACI|nr:hypothetical protein [Neobacillus cucumis]PLS01313.1 hypothetical protein CVD27_26495 [Neobacillus cucumis]
MQTIIWSIGSMVALVLILNYLPLGYTKKGKILVALNGFLLALAGNAASSIFPLWETALMLLALTFFSAYFMNNRLGTVMVKEDSLFEDDWEVDGNDLSTGNVELTPSDSTYLSLEKDASITSDIEELFELTTEINDEDTLVFSKNIETAIQNDIKKTSLLETDFEDGYLSDMETVVEMDTESEPETISDELSILSIISKDDSLSPKSKDASVLDQLEESDHQESGFENNYLSDIESLLEFEEGVSNHTVVKMDELELLDLNPDVEELADTDSFLLEDTDLTNNSEDEGWLEEINDFEELTLDKEHKIVPDETEENFLEELFLASEEAAAGTERINLKKDSNTERAVQLQK